MGYSPWGCKESNTTERTHAGVPRSRDKDHIFEPKMLLVFLTLSSHKGLNTLIQKLSPRPAW